MLDSMDSGKHMLKFWFLCAVCVRASRSWHNHLSAYFIPCRFLRHCLSAVQHGLNLVFLLVELLLNKIPFEPYMLGWLGMYSSAYGLWAFSWYKVTNRWMYPVSGTPAPTITVPKMNMQANQLAGC